MRWRPKFTLRRMFVVIAVLSLVLATSRFSVHRPYYEARGCVMWYHPATRLGAACTWAGKGFDSNYGPDWSVYFPAWNGDTCHASLYWDWYWGGRYTFRPKFQRGPGPPLGVMTQEEWDAVLARTRADD